MFLIAGYDFTGKSSNTTSKGIVVDTTAPIKSSKEITIGGRYITDVSYIEAWYVAT